jgi:glycosyltransferase involved in cell wall biosynthesis
MANYLPLTLASALNQTFKDLEIHIIDDGSTDNTREAIGHFLNDQRVHYHYQCNQGQARAKNRGILESKGNFIAFLDADDIWLPEKLENQLPLFKISDTIGVVYSDEKIIDENGRIIQPDWRKTYYSGKITEPLFIRNFVNFNSTVVKRECFDAVGMFDESLPMSIDWDLWLRISTKYEFAFLDEPTFYYRVWRGQMSHNISRRFECVDKIMSKFLKEHSNLLSKTTINEALADTYTNRGNKASEVDKAKVDALKHYINALKAKPSYFKAWKGIAKLLVR